MMHRVISAPRCLRSLSELEKGERRMAGPSVYLKIKEGLVVSSTWEVGTGGFKFPSQMWLHGKLEAQPGLQETASQVRN